MHPKDHLFQHYRRHVWWDISRKKLMNKRCCQIQLTIAMTDLDGTTWDSLLASAKKIRTPFSIKKMPTFAPTVVSTTTLRTSRSVAHDSYVLLFFTTKEKVPSLSSITKFKDIYFWSKKNATCNIFIPLWIFSNTVLE